MDFRLDPCVKEDESDPGMVVFTVVEKNKSRPAKPNYRKPYSGICHQILDVAERELNGVSDKDKYQVVAFILRRAFVEDLPYE